MPLNKENPTNLFDFDINLFSNTYIVSSILNNYKVSNNPYLLFFIKQL